MAAFAFEMLSSFGFSELDAGLLSEMSDQQQLHASEEESMDENTNEDANEDEEIGLLRKEFSTLRKMFQKTQYVADKWKKEEKALLLLELQLRRLSHKRLPPEEKLPYYEAKCAELRQKSRDSKDYLELQFSELRSKIFYIEVEMERLQRIQKTKHLTKNKPDDMRLEKNLWLTKQLQKKLHSTARDLVNKECIIFEIEQQCREMVKHLNDINGVKEQIRARNEEIKSLKEELSVAKEEAFKNKEENGKLLDKLKANKELYMEEKRTNRTLMTKLEKMSVKG